MILFYLTVLKSGVILPPDASIERRITMIFLTMVVQAVVGANIGIYLYRIWQ